MTPAATPAVTGAGPSLTVSVPRSTPRGVVLLLHGGAEQGLEAIDSRSRPWLRCRLMQLQLRQPLHRDGLAVWLLRYRVRGWNLGHAEHPSPVRDARWALAQVRARYGDLPVALVGHSMGARTAVAVAGDPFVRGVVGLAPWFPPGEPVEPLAGKVLVAAHGQADRVTSPRATEDFVRRAARVAVSAEYVDMGDVGHTLLQRVRDWNRITLDSSLRILGS